MEILKKNKVISKKCLIVGYLEIRVSKSKGKQTTWSKDNLISRIIMVIHLKLRIEFKVEVGFK
jgi:hypothetical protein